MRTMQAEDLGDIRVFEDEVIREQAARLQIHLDNLFDRLNANDCISWKTRDRITLMTEIAADLEDMATEIRSDHPL